MRAALRGRYSEYVYFMGVTDSYPTWFEEELYDSVYTDESRYTFWIPTEQRGIEYFEKQLVADYSVFLRRPDGWIHVTDYDAFSELFEVFTYDGFRNTGLAALKEDCIDYVELKPGVIDNDYPDWFYEYFTEVFNFPNDDETIFVTEGDDISVTMHSVLLRNRFGELRPMDYAAFLRQYDPDPLRGGKSWITESVT